MPELPEVEHLRRSLEPDLVGARVERCELVREDIVRPLPGVPRIEPACLLEGSVVAALERRGKQLAVAGHGEHGVVVRLGMTGGLRWGDDSAATGDSDHVHARWFVRDRHGRKRRLEFRDPRRFGGLSPYRSSADRDGRLWANLGPDAIDASVEVVLEHLRSFARDSRRPLKSLLLDQAAVAGIGNIYADEALFAANLHPRLPSERLSAAAASTLVHEFRLILHQAIEAGGSTLRDYADAAGRAGSFQETHRVYGRAGQACIRCSSRLSSGLIGGRTSVWCPRCQSRSSRPGSRPRSCT